MQQNEDLDRFDLRLLDALQEDAQLGMQALADRIGLSASQCSRRRARLEQLGVITGYHARLDGARLGFGVTAFIQVTLTRHSPDNAVAFRALIERVGAVQEGCALTGDADYLLKVVVADLPGLQRLINEVLLTHDSVAQVRSSIALETIKDTHRLPIATLDHLSVS